MEYIERGFVILLATVLFVYQMLCIYLAKEEDASIYSFVIANVFITSIVCAFALLEYLK